MSRYEDRSTRAEASDLAVTNLPINYTARCEGGLRRLTEGGGATEAEMPVPSLKTAALGFFTSLLAFYGLVFALCAVV
jgi:hypothetical protein